MSPKEPLAKGIKPAYDENYYLKPCYRSGVRTPFYWRRLLLKFLWTQHSDNSLQIASKRTLMVKFTSSVRRWWYSVFYLGRLSDHRLGGSVLYLPFENLAWRHLWITSNLIYWWSWFRTCFCSPCLCFAVKVLEVMKKVSHYFKKTRLSLSIYCDLCLSLVL